MSTVAENLAQIKAEIPDFKGRIIAVTKYVGEDKMIEAYEAGLRNFGENKAQDALIKIENLPKEIVENSTWHFIGHLQSNKVRKVVGKFDYIHSVDSLHLADEIQKQALKSGKQVNVLLQYNKNYDIFSISIM